MKAMIKVIRMMMIPFSSQVHDGYFHVFASLSELDPFYECTCRTPHPYGNFILPQLLFNCDGYEIIRVTFCGVPFI
jgi:hypothetical protein